MAVIAFPHFCFRWRIIGDRSIPEDLLHPGPHLITDQLLIRRAKHVSGHFVKRWRNKQCWVESLGVIIEDEDEIERDVWEGNVMLGFNGFTCGG